MFSSYPKEAKQLLNGCWLIPPSKCRRKKAQIWENCKYIFCDPVAAKIAREVTGNGNALLSYIGFLNTQQYQGKTDRISQGCFSSC